MWGQSFVLSILYLPLKALHKIDFDAVPSLHLFDSLTVPILNYTSEVWNNAFLTCIMAYVQIYDHRKNFSQIRISASDEKAVSFRLPLLEGCSIKL